jgi:aladin
MEWQPNSGSSLAVACQLGVALWKIDLQTTSVELPNPSEASIRGSAWVNFLTFPNHTPVDALSWSSCGRYLATCSSADSALLIWDIVDEKPAPLRRIERRLSLCRWSPDDDYIFSASLSSTVRVWETGQFNSERWSGTPYCKVSLVHIPRKMAQGK